VVLFLLRRLLFGAGTLVLTAFFAYGVIRLLRPELYPGEPLLPSVWSDVERALLHLDFGGACMFPGCPSLRRMWTDGIWADLFLLSGGVVLGLVLGVAGGVWCAARPRARASRALESVAMVFFCTPTYVVGFTLLVLFAPPFGLLHLPLFFDPHSYAPPLQDPWDFTRSMLMPWLIVAAPLAAACLRLTLAICIDTVGEDYVRTASAKGLPWRLVVKRHAAPASYLSVASLFGVSAPIMVTNMVFAEYVFSVPGFFRHMKRALGQAPGWPPTIDFPTLQALAMWASVLIVTLSLLADLAIVRLDPRIRAGGGAPPG
jgi:peptide/nickel transport system permease protein